MTPLPIAGEPARDRYGVVAALLIATAALALIFAFRVGFQASDDASYLDGALGWVEKFPYVGDSHWTLRHTIALPTALLIRLFGLNEAAVSASNILYYLGFLGVNACCMCRHVGGLAAALATVLMIVLPGFTVVATYLNSDMPELFFVCCAFWILVAAREQPQRRAAWLWAGLLLGAAFVTRQTALAAIAFVGALFLFRPGLPRSRYMLLAATFLGVIFADWLYLTWATGDPLYRFMLDFHHDRVDRFAEAARVARSSVVLDKEGNLSVNVYLDPLIALFVSQKYALLFWLAIPATVSAWRHRQGSRGSVLTLAVGLGLTYLLFVALNPRLYLVPRYLIIVAWCAAVVVGAWLATLWSSERRTLCVVALALALGTSLVALAVENTDPRFIERQLVAWVSRHPGQPIYVDPETAIRSRYYFRFAGVPMGAVRTERPGKDATVFYSQERLAQCAAMPRCKDRVVDFAKTSQWLPVESFEAPPRVIGRWLRALGLEGRLPPDIAARLFAPGGRAQVYTVRDP